MMLVYPDKILDHWKIKMVLDYLKYPYTYDPKQEYDIVFNSNRKEKHDFDLKTDKRVINGRCNNVLKDNVANGWYLTHGVHSHVDPQRFFGHCVEKPLKQGTNSGRIVKCPMHPKEGMYYQKWIDTRDSEMFMNDYRVTTCGKEIILVVLKRKARGAMFNYDHGAYPVLKKEDVFSENELTSIVGFAHRIGLDFGDMDILRSNFDGQIYCVDVNNLSGLGAFRNNELLNLVANKFKKTFL